MFLQNNTSNGSGLDQPPTLEEIFPNLRSFRHRLIIGLAISDFLMAFNFICSTTMNLGGRLIDDPEQTDFCKLNGFMAQVFVIQTDYWVLNIAICTFFILTGQRKRASWVQNHEVVIWGLPWFFSVLWASVGLSLNGYHSIGAWCWFKSDKTRLLANFVPRWIIITIMFVLYAYLALVLFRAQNRLSSMQESPGHLESGYSTQDGSRAASTHEGLEGQSMISIRRLKRARRDDAQGSEEVMTDRAPDCSPVAFVSACNIVAWNGDHGDEAAGSEEVLALLDTVIWDEFLGSPSLRRAYSSQGKEYG
ncbi:hypothetical protein CPAR01_05175 [Colletotrichum paranaense]|uniref:G-protein coupled receptors family 2 profile 2 domain-containing protein n=1 Tax=Colletotrichum paranaense TaxID=1914294 RepID=A0ABQ9SQI6_9PEZI|nr:uncharacterized protein CPAR01_05175 [Colletotrichum paranaense]KAK1541788.1 hypothetical protein CPAR01_05175 [Colletotrichum paranaense]